MRQNNYAEVDLKLEEIYQDRLVLWREYVRKKKKFSPEERKELLEKAYRLNDQCSLIVDHFRNEYPNNDRNETALILWNKAEKNIERIRWLEDRLEEECLKHDWKPELVPTKSGGEKWILVCRHCGKEFKKLSNEIKKKYNIL